MTVAGDEPKAKELLTKQADWARVTNQLQDAAQMYMAAGDYLTAIEIIARNDWVDMYIYAAAHATRTLRIPIPVPVHCKIMYRAPARPGPCILLPRASPMH